MGNENRRLVQVLELLYKKGVELTIGGLSFNYLISNITVFSEGFVGVCFWNKIFTRNTC